MGAVTIFITNSGVVAVDGSAAASATVQRLEQMVVNGEATSAVVNFIDGSAPVVERMADINTTKVLWDAFEAQNPPDYVRETFAATLGVLAGLAMAEFGPWASIWADYAVSEMFKTAYDQVRNTPTSANAVLDDMSRTDLSWNGIQKINPFSNDRYSAARGWLRRDPLAIDLDGDGIETVGIAAGVLFDHNGDGIKTGTGWLKGDDAFLVLDRNGNGTIDSGRELFGVDTVVGTDISGEAIYATDGFDALKSIDANGDGVFNSADTQYASVRLWRDLNQDGISQSNELQSLTDAGITAINLTAHTATKNLGNGNTQTLAAATASIVGDTVALNLADNPFYRQFPDHLDTTAVANLPDMQGAGRLRDLKEAATLSSTLQTELRTLSSQGFVNRDICLVGKISRGGTPLNEEWKRAA